MSAQQTPLLHLSKLGLLMDCALRTYQPTVALVTAISNSNSDKPAVTTCRNNRAQESKPPSDAHWSSAFSVALNEKPGVESAMFHGLLEPIKKHLVSKLLKREV